MISSEDKRLIDKARTVMGSRSPELWAQAAEKAGLPAKAEAFGQALRRYRNGYPARLTSNARDVLEAFTKWAEAIGNGRIASTAVPDSTPMQEPPTAKAIGPLLDLLERQTAFRAVLERVPPGMLFEIVLLTALQWESAEARREVTELWEAYRGATSTSGESQGRLGAETFSAYEQWARSHRGRTGS